MYKLDTEKIARHFHKYFKQMGKLRYGDEKLYLEGMGDILDSIGAIHPELVYDLFSLRENIETRIESEAEADSNGLQTS